MRCPSCGAHNRSGLQACNNCGKGLWGGDLGAEQAASGAPVEDFAAPAASEAPLPTPPPVPLDEAAGRVIGTLEPLPPAPSAPALSTRTATPTSSLEDSCRIFSSPGGKRSSSTPELEAVGREGKPPAAPSPGGAEVTSIHERRRLDQSRFEDLATSQRPWSFHGVITRMVGRAAELDALHEAWRSAIQGSRLVLALVSGPVGIGKTRLLDEFALQLERSGRSFSHARISLPEAAADLRSAVLAPLLRARFGLGEELAPVQAAAKLRQELGSSAPPQAAAELGFYFEHLLGYDDLAEGAEHRPEPSPETLDSRAPQALARFLAEGARRQPALWIIDDLERAGAATLEALYDWCCSLGGAPALVVGLATQEAGGQGPLLWSNLPRPTGQAEPLLRRITLGPLSEAETRRLLESFLGHRDLPDALLALAYSKSRGNPLALEQVLELLVEHEVVTHTEQGWKVDPARLAEGDIPVSLEGLVEARLQQLAPEELEILRQAAVQGTTFGLGTILACSRLTRPANADEFWFDERLEQAVRQWLLGLQSRDIIKFLRQGPVAGELQFEFRHSFEREWVYRRCPEGVRALYHRLHAQWLETTAAETGRPLSETVARHFEAGGALRRAAFAYLASARQAARSYRNEEAIFFLRKVIGFLAEDDAATRAEALDELGKIYYGIGDYAAAADAYQRMLRDAYISGVRAKAAAAYEALGRALTDQGSFRQAERCLTRSLDLYDALEDRPGLASALDNLGQLQLKQGGTGAMDKAQRNFERSLQIRRELGDDLGTALSYHLLGWVYTDRGFTHEARLCFREAIRLRAAAGEKDGLCRSLNNLAETYRESGEVAKARPLYEEAFRVAEEIGAQGLQAVILGNLAECDVVEGKLAEASRRLKQAATLSAALGDRPMMVTHLVLRSKLRQLQGDSAGARSSVEEALRLLERLQGTDDLGPALRRLGEILAATTEPGQDRERDLLRARECFRRSIRVLSEAGNDLELARSMEAYAAFLGAQGQGEKGERYMQRAGEILARMNRPEA